MSDYLVEFIMISQHKPFYKIMHKSDFDDMRKLLAEHMRTNEDDILVTDIMGL